MRAHVTSYAALVLLACGGSARTQATPADAGGGSLDAPEVCEDVETSNLPGVSIVLHGPCVLTLAQAAAGVAFPYEVRITQPLAGVVPAPGDAGGCAAPGPSGLVTGASVSGGGQQYCLCDTGLCAPPSMAAVTLSPGTFAATFSWDGRNWTGPSDTGNPEGAPFPPGKYAVRVGSSGTVGGVPFQVTSTLPVLLEP